MKKQIFYESFKQLLRTYEPDTVEEDEDDLEFLIVQMFIIFPFTSYLDSFVVYFNF